MATDRNIERKTLSSGKVRYYVRLTANGERQSFGGYRTLHDARARLRDVESKIAKGTLDKEDALDSEDGITLADFYEQWISAKALKVKPATLEDYKYTFHKYVLPELGEKLLSKENERLIPDDVQKWILGLSAKVGNATVNKAYRYFRNIINSAVAQDKINRTPCRAIDVPSATREPS